jgi:alpha-tubulin suppressor-like RCC1 family protein
MHARGVKVQARVCFVLVMCAVGGCDEEPTVPGGAVAFQAATAGGQHSCAIAVTGVAYCWGRGEAGELGDARYESRVDPRPVDLDVALAAISAGARHTCALSIEGTAYCWGSNFRGQLGNGTDVDQATPIPIAPTLRFVRVSSGWFHTCGLTNTGDAYCWGANEQGQLGDGTTNNRATPVRVSGPRLADIAAGGFHSCGVTASGVVYCWGLNNEGQLGTGNMANASRPTRVEGDITFREINAGFTHTCGVDRAGAAYCWGSNEYGELGVAGVSSPGLAGTTTPTAVHGGYAFLNVDAGADYTCGVADTRRAHCWGRGFEGQLGNGANANWQTPQPVADVMDFVAVSAGGEMHACGHTASNAVYCWGRGELGQLGNRSVFVSGLPVRVAW